MAKNIRYDDKFDGNCLMCKEPGKPLYQDKARGWGHRYCYDCYKLRRTVAFRDKLPSKRTDGKRFCTSCKEEFDGVMGSKCNDCKVAYKRYALYNITDKEYQDIRREQGYKCCICKKPEIDFISARHPVGVVVDHCHTTGQIRGLLCGKCNTLLGWIDDNLDILDVIKEYLTRKVDYPYVKKNITDYKFVKKVPKNKPTKKKLPPKFTDGDCPAYLLHTSMPPFGPVTSEYHDRVYNTTISKKTFNLRGIRSCTIPDEVPS